MNAHSPSRSSRGCAVDQHLAGRRLLQAREDVEQGALAAAARPEDGDELARLRDEVDAVERDDRLAVGALERLAEAAHLEPRAGAHADPRASAGGRHGIASRSISETRPNRSSVSAAVTSTAPKTRSVRKAFFAVVM